MSTQINHSLPDLNPSQVHEQLNHTLIYTSHGPTDEIASVRDLKSFGATPSILSLEESTVPQLVELLTSNKPDVVVFAAGAGGKGDKSRTRKVDFEGAVKVYDAMEMANVKRLIVVGAIDIRDRSKDVPSWYNEADSEIINPLTPQR